jgi:hypothetical protein
MHSFRDFLQDLNLTELHLYVWLSTWSNEHAHPYLKELIETLSACIGVIYFLTTGCELLPLPILTIPLL